VVEATFTPYFKVFLDHEDKLFRPGDERVASSFIWHFVEEIEHRSSALLVYDAVHDGYPYRVKTIGGVIKHVSGLLSIISSGFQWHVPKEEASHELTRAGQDTYAGVEVLGMLAGLVRSQGPNHNPESEKLPDLVGRWFKKYNANPKIAARWYTVGAGVD
jgi:predicted metal-dependent hydrolase